MQKLIPLALAALLVTPLAAAQGGTKPTPPSKPTAVQTMAGILMRLNHFPSDPEKATLKTIVDDKAANDAERTVAQALINVQHKVAAADAPKLQALAKDPKASDSVKTLASVILALNHTPTDAEKEKLKKIASP
jgi:hypothetical protein